MSSVVGGTGRRHRLPSLSLIDIAAVAAAVVMIVAVVAVLVSRGGPSTSSGQAKPDVATTTSQSVPAPAVASQPSQIPAQAAATAAAPVQTPATAAAAPSAPVQAPATTGTIPAPATPSLQDRVATAKANLLASSSQMNKAAGTSGYGVGYNEKADAFSIGVYPTIFSPPAKGEDLRRQAEQEVLARAGGDKEAVCQLRAQTITYTGEGIAVSSLSFCRAK